MARTKKTAGRNAVRTGRARKTRSTPSTARHALAIPLAWSDASRRAAQGMDGRDSLRLVRTIVYVHGIGNKPVASILKCQWDHALFGFDLGERSRLAYWVNRAFYPTPVAATCSSGDISTAVEAPDHRLGTRALREPSLERDVAALTDNKKEAATLLALARKMQASAADAQTGAATGARGLGTRALPLPRPAREWITALLVRTFLQDVNDFFYVPERRRQMRESVLERLRVGGGPFVVIGHSQGSMVAFDALSSAEASGFEVPLFITIGSPLGITEVQDQMQRLTGQSRLRVPPCVGHWINVADPLDPVALDKTLQGEYAPAAKTEDAGVTNCDSPRHPHSATGYLRTERVRRPVREIVETSLFQPVASFKLARDIARDLEDRGPAVRHKVLLELATENVRDEQLDETGPAW